jgi:predicted DNA-binding transcriptional regulator AlpA
MKHDWVKIPLVAKELGVSVKTIYNWISVGKLFMPRPGYVSQIDAYEVWLEQKSLRSAYSQVLASQGTKRGPNGQFQSKGSKVEEGGE